MGYRVQNKEKSYLGRAKSYFATKVLVGTVALASLTTGCGALQTHYPARDSDREKIENVLKQSYGDHRAVVSEVTSRATRGKNLIEIPEEIPLQSLAGRIDHQLAGNPREAYLKQKRDLLFEQAATLKEITANDSLERYLLDVARETTDLEADELIPGAEYRPVSEPLSKKIELNLFYKHGSDKNSNTITSFLDGLTHQDLTALENELSGNDEFKQLLQVYKRTLRRIGTYSAAWADTVIHEGQFERIDELNQLSAKVRDLLDGTQLFKNGKYEEGKTEYQQIMARPASDLPEHSRLRRIAKENGLNLSQSVGEIYEGLHAKIDEVIQEEYKDTINLALTGRHDIAQVYAFAALAGIAELAPNTKALMAANRYETHLIANKLRDQEVPRFEEVEFLRDCLAPMIPVYSFAVTGANAELAFSRDYLMIPEGEERTVFKFIIKDGNATRHGFKNHDHFVGSTNPAISRFGFSLLSDAAQIGGVGFAAIEATSKNSSRNSTTTNNNQPPQPDPDPDPDPDPVPDPDPDPDPVPDPDPDPDPGEPPVGGGEDGGPDTGN